MTDAEGNIATEAIDDRVKAAFQDKGKPMVFSKAHYSPAQSHMVSFSSNVISFKTESQWVTHEQILRQTVDESTHEDSYDVSYARYSLGESSALMTLDETSFSPVNSAGIQLSVAETMTILEILINYEQGKDSVSSQVDTYKLKRLNLIQKYLVRNQWDIQSHDTDNILQLIRDVCNARRHYPG